MAIRAPDGANNGDHIITMVMIMSLRFLDVCSLIFTTDNATICKAPLISFTSSGCPGYRGKYGVRDTMLMKLKVHNLSKGILESLCRTSSQKSKRLVDSLCSDPDITQSPHN